MSATSSARVDYSEVVSYLKKQEWNQTSQLLRELLPRLEEYLKITMGATVEEAKESVQRAFLNVYEQILKEKLREPKALLSYMMRACRNEYITYMRDQKRYGYSYDDALSNQFVVPAKQISNLVDQERMEVLEQCLNELDKESCEFMTYLIANPDTTTKEASAYFGMSEANVRTKKSRLTKQLHEMYVSKSAFRPSNGNY